MNFERTLVYSVAEFIVSHVKFLDSCRNKADRLANINLFAGAQNSVHTFNVKLHSVFDFQN